MTDAMVLDGEHMDDAIIGHIDDGDSIRVVYDLDKLVDAFAKQFSDCDDPVDAAQEWISYNVMPALAYPGMPVLMYPGGRVEVDEAADNLD
jgi:hypothetical protein